MSKYCLGLLSGLLFCLSAFSDDIPEKEVSFTTSDDIQISATLIASESYSPEAAVILIHSGASTREEWRFLFQKLATENYRVLAIDLRGHGKSAGKMYSDGLSIFGNPNMAPRDLEGAINYLKKRPDVDGSRIGVIGASIGANVVVAGSHRFDIATGVFISGKTDMAQALANSKDLDLRSIYYISSMEMAGLRATWAKELYEMTGEPRKLTVVKKSRSHGVGIFQDAPELANQVLDWLANTL